MQFVRVLSGLTNHRCLARGVLLSWCCSGNWKYRLVFLGGVHSKMTFLLVVKVLVWKETRVVSGGATAEVFGVSWVETGSIVLG